MWARKEGFHCRSQESYSWTDGFGSRQQSGSCVWLVGLRDLRGRAKVLARNSSGLIGGNFLGERQSPSGPACRSWRINLWPWIQGLLPEEGDHLSSFWLAETRATSQRNIDEALLFADNLTRRPEFEKLRPGLYDVPSISNTGDMWRPIWKPASSEADGDAALIAKLLGDMRTCQGIDPWHEIRVFPGRVSTRPCLVRRSRL